VEKPLADIIWNCHLVRGGLVKGYGFTQGVDNDTAVIATLHVQFDLIAELLGQFTIMIPRE
jgi:hypothetical protein